MTVSKFKNENASVTVYLEGPKWNKKPAATFGNFTVKTNAAGREILIEAIEFVRANGITQIIGPMNGDTWHSYRFVTESDDSAPYLLEPKNRPEEVEIFKSAGFVEISKYFSARVALINTTKNTLAQSENLTVEAWDGSNPEELFAQVYELSSQAFSKNAFYKPIAEDEFMKMYLPMVPMMKRELIFFVRDETESLVGFLFGIPNYSQGPQTKTVILKTYASLVRGAGQLLAHSFHKAAFECGYNTAIHALIHDDNQSAQRSALEGATVFRRYGLFGLKLHE